MSYVISELDQLVEVFGVEFSEATELVLDVVDCIVCVILKDVVSVCC